MNKLLKGSIAGAVGVALLLGGGGTLALWNNAAVINEGSVTSGVLTIASGGTGTWKNIAADIVGTPVPLTAAALAAYKIVPGDKLELTQSVTINAVGDNLKATLTYDPLSITGNSALKGALVYALTIPTPPSTVKTATATNTYTVAPSAGATTFDVKLTIELPSTTTGVVGQSGTIDLTALGFSLAQTR